MKAARGKSFIDPVIHFARYDLMQTDSLFLLIIVLKG